MKTRFAAWLFLAFLSFRPLIAETAIDAFSNAREVLDPAGTPEVFLLPQEIAKAFMLPVKIDSPSSLKLQNQLRDARKFFGAPQVGLPLLRMLYDVWSSDDLRKQLKVDWVNLQKVLSDESASLTVAEKTLLVYGLSFVELEWLRVSQNPSDQKQAADVLKRMESSNELKRQLLEVDPYYRARLDLKPAAPVVHQWSDAELKKIETAAQGFQGEISDEPTLKTILERTKAYRRAQLNQEGWLRYLEDEDENQGRSINPGVPVMSVSIIAIALLWKAWMNAQKREDIPIHWPRSMDSYEKQMIENGPKSWSRLFEYQKLEKIRYYVDHPKERPSEEVGPEFMEALSMARALQQAKKKFEEMVLVAHHGHPYWEAMQAEIEKLEALGDERMKTFMKRVRPALDDLASGGMKLRDAYDYVLREYLQRKSQRALDKEQEAELTKAIERVVDAFPFSKRIQSVDDNLRGVFDLPSFTVGRRAKKQRNKEMATLRALYSLKPRAFQNFELRKNPVSVGAKYSAMIPGSSVGSAGRNLSCARVASRLGTTLMRAAALSGFGYGLGRILMKPGVETQVEQEDRKEKMREMKEFPDRIDEMSPAMASLYSSGLQSEIETWAKRENLEVVFSNLTKANAETGLGSQIYVLVKAKEDPSAGMEFRHAEASQGVLLRFVLDKVGLNSGLANKWSMSANLVPEKMVWKFEGSKVLTGNTLARRMVLLKTSNTLGPADLSIRLEHAKEAMSGP